MTGHVLSVLIAFVAYSILDIAKAIQKIALEQGRRSRAAGALIWFAATSSTTLSSFLLLYAVSLGSVVIVGALGGSGLAALTLFSVLVMKEKASFREYFGVGAILAGPIVMTLFSGTSSDTLQVKILILFTGSVITAYSAAIYVFRRKSHIIGVIIGGLSGAFSGSVLLFQKVATTTHGRSHTWVALLEENTRSPLVKNVLEILVNPYSVTWVALSILSTLVLQFSYRHDRAIRIVPVFAANSILIPIIGGLLGFNEILHPGEWTGIGLILAGVVLVTFKPKNETATLSSPS